MTTSRTVTFEYSQPPAEVAALLQDPIYLRYRSESAGERNIDVRVENTPAGTRVTVSREKDVDVPAFARMIVGNSNKAIESTVWRSEGERWYAEYTIDVPGLPVKTKGKSTLSPSPRGCMYSSTFEVTARIPLIGGKIEGLVVDGLQEQLLANADRNATALARNAERGPRSFIDGLREQGSQKSAQEG